jgi:SPX domain
VLAHVQLGISKCDTMKFGRNLPRNQVPEWASSYINYKGLKKLIKTAAEASNTSSELDLAGTVSGFWWGLSSCRFRFLFLPRPQS